MNVRLPDNIAEWELFETLAWLRSVQERGLNIDSLDRDMRPRIVALIASRDQRAAALAAAE